jgi:hypothetical protein
MDIERPKLFNHITKSTFFFKFSHVFEKKMIKIFNLHIRIWIRKSKYPHPESEHYMVTVSSPDSDKALKYPSLFLEDKIAIKKGKTI